MRTFPTDQPIPSQPPNYQSLLSVSTLMPLSHMLCMMCVCTTNTIYRQRGPCLCLEAVSKRQQTSSLQSYVSLMVLFLSRCMYIVCCLTLILLLSSSSASIPSIPQSFGLSSDVIFAKVILYIHKYKCIFRRAIRLNGLRCLDIQCTCTYNVHIHCTLYIVCYILYMYMCISCTMYVTRVCINIPLNIQLCNYTLSRSPTIHCIHLVYMYVHAHMRTCKCTHVQ